jgi:hypothetical protein
VDKLKFKGIKPVNKIPKKGIFTKTAKTIFDEFLKTEQKQGVADLDATEEELMSLYNAMKSLLRRDVKYKGKIQCSLNKKEKRIYLWKE